jgi:hypothetical protein
MLKLESTTLRIDPTEASVAHKGPISTATSGYGLRVGPDRKSGNAEIRAQSRARQGMPSARRRQIAEITSRLFGARQQPK